MKEKTLYEILEVSENASKEIIEKAYKTLVKKYHPDLQQGTDKMKAEEMMKKLNEAYEVLSDEEKRSRYDLELEEKRQEEMESSSNVDKHNSESYNTVNSQDVYNNYNAVNNKNYNQNNSKNWKDTDYEKKIKKEEERLRRKMQDNLNAEYQNAYENYLRSLGYKVKHGWTKERIKALLITLAVIIGIILILWFLPPTHNWLVGIYESNGIIKTFVDIIVAIVTGIFKGIGEFFASLFE